MHPFPSTLPQLRHGGGEGRAGSRVGAWAGSGMEWRERREKVGAGDAQQRGKREPLSFI